MTRPIVDALTWALDQIEDDACPDHQAALQAAHRTLAAVQKASSPTPGLIGAAMLEALEVARDWCLAELEHPGVHDPQDLLDTLEAAIELATSRHATGQPIKEGPQ